MLVEKSDSFHQLLEGGQYNPIVVDVDSEDVSENRSDVWAFVRKSEAETAVKNSTWKIKSTKGKKGKDNNKCNNKNTVEDKNRDISSPPDWPFPCVREIENAKRERIERMGVVPAFDADMKALADKYGTMAAVGKAFLASLSDDSSDDERCREISARHAKMGIGNGLA